MKTRGVVRAAIGGIVLLGVGLCLAPRYRSWSAQRTAESAIRFLEQTNFSSACLSARRALSLNSNSVSACRVMALLSEQTRSPRAIAWRQKVVSLEPNAVTNRLALARTALLFNELGMARQALTPIGPQARSTNLLYHELAADIAFAEQDMATAQTHLLQAAALAPDNPIYRHNLHIAQLHDSDTNVQQRAREALDTGRTDRLYGTAILRALTREAVSRGAADRAYGLSTELQARPDTRFDDLLLHLALLKSEVEGHSVISNRATATPPLSRPTLPPVLTEFIRRVQREAGGNPEQVCLLANWLNTHGLAKAALPWLETLPEETRNTTSVRLVETECHLLLKNWRLLGEWLKACQWGADEHLRHALLALVYRQDGDQQLAEIEWKRAVRASRDGTHAVPNSQEALVRLAGAWSWENEAEALLWEIAAGTETRWALSLLKKAYELAGDTRSLLRVFRAEARSNPEDIVARNNVAAASLLLSTNLATAHASARQIYEAQPTNSAMASTYAYSMHLQGRTSEAIKMLSQFTEESLRQPSLAAYFGVLWAAQGSMAKAETYLEFARQGPLLPEERKLVEAALQQCRGSTN